MTATSNNEDSKESRPAQRIHAIDAARGVALLAMAIYHFTWDLDFFGYLPSGISSRGGWAIFAHLIAGSFLFLAGFSQFIAHGRKLRLHSFVRRVAVLVLASAAISIVSWFTTPNALIYFGILHNIALASIIGLLFLRAPALITLIIAILLAVLPYFVKLPALDPRYLAWIGMTEHPPASNDYVPLLPWIGPFLAGLAISKISYGWLKQRKQLPTNENALTFIGRHSLAFYLLHQPILFALVWVATFIIPVDPAPSYLSSCQLNCKATNGAEFCQNYCRCTLDALENEGLLKPLMRNQTTDSDNIALGRIAMMCSSQ